MMDNRQTAPDKISHGGKWLSILLALCVLAGLFPVTARAEAAPALIRVGYFAFDGYHNQDADGNRSGYGYEYLQQMARYTGWTYDYVGYDKSWGEAQSMLESGEIDILTSAQKTAERERIFDFSNEPIGYSSTMLTIKAGNDRYTLDNFSTLNGVRVGMLRGNSRNESFADFAAQKGFTYEAIMFDDQQELAAALQAESIGAIVTSSLRTMDNEWVVAEFDVSPYYVCVKKGNSELLNEVNYAISQINRDNPSLQNELNEKYYGVDSGETVAFTEAERDYISQHQSNGEKLRVVINPDRLPLSYYENGQLNGVFGVIAQKVLERSGLPYAVVVPANRQEYNEYRSDGQADILLDVRFDYNQAEKQGYRITNSYYSAYISQLTRKDFSGTVESVAMIRNSDVLSRLERFYADKEIAYYDSTDECVQAVLSGEQDTACLYSTVAEHIVRQDETNHLVSALLPDISTDFCFGICDESDKVLFSILNKCIKSIDRTWMEGVATSYSASYQAKTSLTALIYDYPLLALLAATIFVCLIALIIFLFIRQRAQRRDRENAMENERLLGYVCRANEQVMEVNLKTMRCRNYSMANGSLHMEESPYDSELRQGNFIHPDDHPKVAEFLSAERVDELIQAGGEFSFEARSRYNAEDYKWYLYTLEGIRPNKQHPHNIMVFKRNIAALKEQEEKSRQLLMSALASAEQASRAKGDFMSRMSHEIRTPLNAIIGYLDIAQSEQNDAKKVAHCLEQSKVATRHLLSVINDVLDISSIEAGRMKIANEDFDLSGLIHSLTTIFYAQAKAKGVHFDASVADLTEEWVCGDSLRVNQILMNLLSNAVKFTPEGGEVKLAIHQIAVHENRAHLEFKVTDTGIGMSEEYLNRIFQPFEQESAGTTRTYGGSGLGLSICFNLVKMMGGTIQVTSEPGKGSEFTVLLAFDRASKENGHPLSTESFSDLRCLVVDDEENTCEYVQKLLERCGVKCDTVTSGKKALRRIKSRKESNIPYNFCILDWNMPEMNGLDTAREIRALCGDELPIIIATAYDYSSIEEEAVHVGVNKIVSKPLFQSTVFDMLVNTFGKYEPAQAEKAAKPKADFHGLRVILAEDNAMNMEIAQDILTRAGMIITPAVNGKEAVELFTASEPGAYAAILMDVQMPVMDGYEASCAIRKSSHPEAKTIPIIAMTANAFTSDITAALAAGMNDHVAKPISYDRLYDALSRLTSKNRETNYMA